MNGHRFDLLTKMLTSRRAALRAGGLGLAAAAVAPLARVAAQESTPSADLDETHPNIDENLPEPEFLFVQPFDGGTWLPKPGEEGVYVLTLTGADANTIYFSDRPDRIVGLAPTAQFLEGLGFTPANPPNAAIVADRLIGKEQEVLVVELFNPVYDAESGTLTYDARVLADYGEHGLLHLALQQQDYELGEAFGAGSLFIDDCESHKWTCYMKTDGSKAGITEVRYCYDWATLSCKKCHDPEKYCADNIVACLGVDGSRLCYAEKGG